MIACLKRIEGLKKEWVAVIYWKRGSEIKYRVEKEMTLGITILLIGENRVGWHGNAYFNYKISNIINVGLTF